MSFDFETDKKGYLKRRESFDLEFKENFHGGDAILKYLKTLVGMANNKGGMIVFGIKDKPHIPLGMQSNKFKETDPKVIDRYVREYFSGEIIWSSKTLEFNNKEFGVLVVEEAKYKPIICRKNKDSILREGAIYYRYRGESKEIEFAELSILLQNEREKEKALWVEHIQKISLIGPQNVHLLDVMRSELDIGNGTILIDKNVIEKIKFIKEGHFVENEGAPALKLIGDITGLVDVDKAIPTDKVYNLFRDDILGQLDINAHDFKCISWKLEIKGDKKYHNEIKSGKNSNSIHKYSPAIIDYIKIHLESDTFLKECRDEYRKANPVMGGKGKKKKK